MAWLYLILAGILEIGWPLGFKLSQTEGFHRIGWILFAILSMTLSGFLLYLAQKSIPMGTAYAIWTGIGAAGTFLVGVFLFSDPSTFLRYLGVLLIISGVVILQLAH